MVHSADQALGIELPAIARRAMKRRRKAVLAVDDANSSLFGPALRLDKGAVQAALISHALILQLSQLNCAHNKWLHSYTLVTRIAVTRAR